MNPRRLRLAHPNVSTSEILGQTERILASRHFRSAKSLERFLRHVVEKKLNGEENSLKEYSIGLEVFQWGINYDPKSDAVVRVQATLLRKKLAAVGEISGNGHIQYSGSTADRKALRMRSCTGLIS